MLQTYTWRLVNVYGQTAFHASITRRVNGNRREKGTNLSDRSHSESPTAANEDRAKQADALVTTFI